MEIYRTAGRLAIRRQCAAVFEENLVVSSCTMYTKEGNINECVISPCMVMKTIGIPSCTGTPGQPRKFVKCYAWISSYSVYKVGDTDNVRIFFTLQKRLRILNKGRIFPREN